MIRIESRACLIQGRSMKSKVAIILMLAAGVLCGEETISVISDKTRSFTNAEVYKVTTSEVWVKVGAGLARVPLAEVSPELQKKFSYDPVKAEAEKQAALGKEAAQMETLRLKLEATQNADIERWRKENLRLVDGKIYDKSDLTVIFGPVISVTKEGLLVNNRCDTVFLSANTKGITDGATVDGYGLPKGTYQYVAVGGAVRTVKSYTLASQYKALQGETIAPPKQQPQPTADKKMQERYGIK